VGMYANFYLLRTAKLWSSSSTRKFNHEDIYECVLILEKEGVGLSKHIRLFARWLG
jgi:hypothetical protein